MKKMITMLTGFVLLVAMTASITGCTTFKKVGHDIGHAGKEVGHAAKKATKDVGHAIKEG